MAADRSRERPLKCQQMWKDLSDEEFLARMEIVLDPDVDAMTRWRLLRELRDLYDQRSRFFHTLWEVMGGRLESDLPSYLPDRDELRRILAREAWRLREEST